MLSASYSDNLITGLISKNLGKINIEKNVLRSSSTKKYVFQTRDGSSMGLSPAAEDSDVYLVYTLEPVKKLLKANKFYDAAVEAGVNYFEEDGTIYFFEGEGIQANVYTATEVAVASKRSFTSYSKDTKLSYEFYRNALVAVSSFKSSITQTLSFLLKVI